MTSLTATPAPTRGRIVGWMMFDWASQPYSTLVVTFVFGPYFASVALARLTAEGHPDPAAGAQSLWAAGLTVGGLAVALTAPLLGALADASRRRMPLIAGLSALYVAATAGLWVLRPDGTGLQAALILVALGMVATEFLTVLTNAMLPGLAGGTPERMGRISGTGYALGYAGGVLALVITLGLLAETEAGTTMLAGIPPILGLDPDAREGTRAVGPFTALWFAVFMVPFFLLVRDGPEAPAHPSAGAALRALAATLRGVLRRPSLAAYLGGSMLYRDALAALYAFGGTYAVLVLGWEITEVGVFGVIAAITAGIASWAGGRADEALGPKPVVTGAVVVLTLICAAVTATTPTRVLGVPVAEGSAAPDVAFYVLGSLIGAAGGVLQSASRTLMARHASAGRDAEAFGLYALSGKATAFLAPAAIGLVTTATGSPRAGLLPLIALFLAGLALLSRVRPEGDAA